MRLIEVSCTERKREEQQESSSLLHIMDNSNRKTLASLCGRTDDLISQSNSVAGATSDQDRKLFSVETSTELLREIFDASTQAIVVVDKDCGIEAINLAARSSLECNAHITVTSRATLQLTNDASQVNFRKQVAKITAGLLDRYTLRLDEASPTTEPLAWMGPLHGSRKDHQNSLAIIRLNSPKPAHYNHQLATSLFKLSRAELAICEALVSGETVKSISEARGTSTETVRYQLKSIFSKTHSNSQHGLVSLLLRVTPLPSFK